MSAEVAVAPERDLIGLASILRTNHAAYTDLVGSYQKTAGPRATDAPKLLDPVLTAARELGPARSVLELGCADGVFTSWLAREGLSVTAIEYSEGMRRAAEDRLRADGAPVDRVTFLPHEFHNGDAPLASLEGRRFDVVVAMAFVHLFPARIDLEVLRRIREHLAPHGVAFLTTTVEQEDRRGFDLKRGPHGSRVRYRSRYTEDTFLGLVAAAGLEVRDKRCLVDPRAVGKTWLDVVAGHPGEPALPDAAADGRSSLTS
ncbi:hypothetical protein GCM10028784_23040 [Myceligenerans cantabricum]